MPQPLLGVEMLMCLMHVSFFNYLCCHGCLFFVGFLLLFFVIVLLFCLFCCCCFFGGEGVVFH